MAEPDDELFLGEWMDGRRSRDDLEAQVGAEAAEAYTTILKEVDTWTLPPVDKEAGLDRLRSLRKENTPPAGKQVRMTPVRWAVAIAASVTLLVVGYFAFQDGGPTQYQTAFGETNQFTLPDGSTVTLNTSSMASFEEDTWQENRQVELTGEAYFEVARGARFTVQLNDQTQVQVLGTRFLVRQRENYLMVACYEGLVGVNSSGGKDSLRAGSLLRYDGDSLAITQLEVLRPEWITNPGATSFKDAPLGEVLKALEAQYGVKVLAITGVDVSRPYTGNFVHSDLSLALRMVTEPLQLSFEEISEGNYRVF